MPNLAYPDQHTEIKTTFGSKEDVIMPDNVKITFNLHIKSTFRTSSIVNNVVKPLMKKKVLILRSKT